jgi:1-acyl-sn-glycerol-3-phosphate acyltransferase
MHMQLEQADHLQLPTVAALRRSLFDDFFRNRGYDMDGWFRRVMEPMLTPAVDRFVRLGFEFDRVVAESGIIQGMRWLLPRFARSVDEQGAGAIPQDGPVLIVSNHPGTFDEVVISSHLPRPDLKIVANGLPILRALPAVREHCIFLAPDPHARMGTVRAMIKSLRAGDSLLLFPSGRVEPDPQLVDGSSERLEEWSPSLRLILEKAPETRVVVTMVSGVVSPAFFRTPFARRRRRTFDQQKLAVGLHVPLQMVWPRLLHTSPRVTFSPPCTAAELMERTGLPDIQQAIIAQARSLLPLHAGQEAGA